LLKLENCINFFLDKITNITIKRYTYSLDSKDDDERYFDIWLMIRSDDFREFPIIPDRGVVGGTVIIYIVGLNIGLDKMITKWPRKCY